MTHERYDKWASDPFPTRTAAKTIQRASSSTGPKTTAVNSAESRREIAPSLSHSNIVTPGTLQGHQCFTSCNLEASSFLRRADECNMPSCTTQLSVAVAVNKTRFAGAGGRHWRGACPEENRRRDLQKRWPRIFRREGSRLLC